MMGKAHFIIGTGVSLSLLALSGQPVTAGAVAIAGVSSLLPDIDHPNSILVTRALPDRLLRILQSAMLLVAAAVLFYAPLEQPWNSVLAAIAVIAMFLPEQALRKGAFVLIGLAVIIFGERYAPWNRMGGILLIVFSLAPHRGITHTVYATAAWTLLLYGLTGSHGSSIWIAGGLAYALHLICDSLTKNGIRPLPPLKWKLRFALMTTGKKSGKRVERIGIGLTAVLFAAVFGIRLIEYAARVYLQLSS
ncbi:metal-dependent hydrolase [Saccharibacillus sp. CPCC 101409]|uniref:metal-dependent hydrolase n=1 Tax=Saccharibacillus sp. CPCC 101409 TaxID=3058041 RepID=UPI0026740BEF|nr:metal-dependent hydrolase [Saccharibacillus sp. CPCC 101409]MDO3408514.1 metal-dependent hydrolase [Saccharibacillus sp. CPCC 101409]